MLGLVSHLADVGSAEYSKDLAQASRWIKYILGDSIRVLPFPMLLKGDCSGQG